MTKYFSILFSAILVTIDQLIKFKIVNTLSHGNSIMVIPSLFNITYVKNEGAAFGILQGRTVFLSVIVSLVIICGIFIVFSGRIKESFLIWTIALIIAGGVGNLIDRISRGFVVDYLDFSALFGFPVFNFADCCVVVGTFLLLFYIIRQDIIEKKQGKA